jgi:hypothetical protein
MQVAAVAYFFDGNPPRDFFNHVSPNSVVDLISGATSHAPVAWVRELTEDEFGSFQAGTHKVLFMGYVRYVDIFGKLHRTVFSNELHYSDLRSEGPAMLSATRKHNKSN